MTTNVGWPSFTCSSGIHVPESQLLAVLVVQHGVAMRERAAPDVLAREPHA